jgi:hypothetical protein
LGASPGDLQNDYDTNKSYQKPSKPVDEDLVQKLKDREEFRSQSGKRENYSNFLVFFQREIEAKGVSPVINEYIFAGDEYADDMLFRLFGGELDFKPS